MEEEYLELAAAIVKLAVKDYEAVYRHFLRSPESRTAKAACEKEKKFFYSQWFEMLSDLDGPTLVRKVEEHVRDEMRKKGGGAK